MARLAINGAAGRMGSLVKEKARDFGFKEILCFDLKEEKGVFSYKDMGKLLKKGDMLIDFSSTKGALFSGKICAQKGAGFICSVTGFSQKEKNEIKKLGKKIPVFVSPNMSLAVNLTFIISKILAENLDFDIHIHETHHTKKKDAPSGTALRYLEFINSAGKKAAITSARAGDIAGEHSVLYAGAGEKITLSHTATNRAIFAIGALKAALWLSRQKKGFYSFSDFFKINL